MDYDFYWADDDSYGQRIAQRARPEIAPSDHVQLSRVQQLHVHVSVRQQVLPLEPEYGRYLGDCHGDERGRHCNEDSQAGT
jgi:hypothetical protein